MTSSSSRIALAVAASLTLLATAPAYSAQRTFVSTSGINNPACSLIAPCRDFATAIAATSPGGEVIVLDSGGYGKVTITQSVSIIAAPGVYAGVSVFAPDDGVTVAAGASDKVTLRGLTINGQGGVYGVLINSADQVDIENCTITNMQQSGIRIVSASRVYIRDSLVRNNLLHGVAIEPPATSPYVQIDDSKLIKNGSGGVIMLHTGGTLNANRLRAENNGTGVNVFGGATGAFVTLTDSVLSGNSPGPGARLGSLGGDTGPSEMKVVRTTSTNNLRAGFDVDGTDGPRTFVLSDSAAIANGQSTASPGIALLGTVTATITGSTIARNACYGVSVGAVMAIVSGSTITGNGCDGVISQFGTANVSGSTSAGNVGADLSQSGAGVLLSSGTNVLTGRGAADISGTLTPNPLK